MSSHRCTRMGAVAALLFCFSLSPRAWAEQVFVETAGMSRRAEADDVVASLARAGHEAEVVRRFRRGAGWEFVVRLPGVENREEALDLAVEIGSITGVTAQVYIRAGKDLLPLQQVGPLSSPGPVERSDDEAAGDPAGGSRLLAAVRRAHGEAAAEAVASATDLHFRFERRLKVDGDRLRAWHDYRRAGGTERLQVRILEGEGRDSVALVRPGEGAWLLLDGAVSEVEPGPVRELLGAFRPEVVLARSLRVADLEEGRDVLLLPTAPDEMEQLLIRMGDGQADQLLQVDRADHRVREVLVGEGPEAVTWRFGDYEELAPGLVLPRLMEVWRGGDLQERLTVLSLDLEASASPGELQVSGLGQ